MMLEKILDYIIRVGSTPRHGSQHYTLTRIDSVLELHHAGIKTLDNTLVKTLIADGSLPEMLEDLA